MKYLLPIDVPTLDDGRHLCNECPIWNKERLFCEYDFNMEVKGCPLKPMPLKRETMIHWKSIGGGDIPTHEPSGEDIGWNKCVEYLEGDMQDD